MQSFTIYTLVDITQTNQYHHQPGLDLHKQQQQNFFTLVQTIGLRVNPLYEIPPKVIDDLKVSELPFGTAFKGKHRVWCWEFDIEFDGVFDDEGNPVGKLISDLNLIPVITGLTETAKLNKSMFDTVSDENRNTLVFQNTNKY